MATAPAFQDYPKDFLSDGRVPGMPLAAVGLFYLLKQRAWLDGTIPNDPTAVARLLGRSVAEVRRLWPDVVPFFQPVDDRLTLPALDEQRQRHAEWREKSIRGGKKSGETRKSTKGGSTTVEPSLGNGGSTTVEPSTGDAVEPDLNTAFCVLQSPISDLHAARGESRADARPPALARVLKTFASMWADVYGEERVVTVTKAQARHLVAEIDLRGEDDVILAYRKYLNCQHDKLALETKHSVNVFLPNVAEWLVDPTPAETPLQAYERRNGL